MVSKGIQCGNSTQHQCISKNIFLKTIPNGAVFKEEKCPNTLLGIICQLGAGGLILLFESFESTKWPSVVTGEKKFLDSLLEVEKKLNSSVPCMSQSSLILPQLIPFVLEQLCFFFLPTIYS